MSKPVTKLTTPLVPRLRFPEFSVEWDVVRLKDMLNNIVDNRGKTPPISQSGTPMIEVNSLGGLWAETSNIKKFVDKKVYDNWFRNHLKDKDLLFSTVGATALCSLYNGTKEAVIAQNIVGLRTRDNDPFYLYYLLTEPKNNHKFKRIEMGAVQPSVKVSQMIHIKFLVASKSEQKKIADFLTKVDAWLTNLKSQKQELENYKKGLTQKIFSQQIRFKDENGKEYSRWKEVCFEEIATFLKGSGISKEDIKPDGRNRCVRYGELYTDYKEIITKVKSKTNRSLELSVLSKLGDILMPSSGETAIDISTASCVLENDVILGGDINIVRLSKNNNGVFYAYYLKNFLRSEIAKIAQGNSVVHLYSSELKKIKVCNPTNEEQQLIANFLTSIDKVIESKQNQIIEAENWKKGLLQLMFV